MELKSCPLLFSVLLILVASFHYQVSAIPGGYQPIKNLNSTEVLDIARFAVSEYNKQHDAKLQFVKVLKGDYQIVSGVNYKLVIKVIDTAAGNAPANYEAVVYDKPWEGIRKLISFVPRLLGGYKPIENLNSTKVLDIARFAVSEYNKQHDAKLQFVKVVKGESQIVSGVNYRLVINVIDTAVGNLPVNYEAVVYDKPWEGIRKLISFVSSPLPGGYQLIENLNSKEVLDIARFAVSEYNKQQHDAKLQFVKVLKGYYQIVAGVNYRLLINVIDTAAGNAPANYVAEVYDIPWEGKRQLTSFVKSKLV